MANDRNPTAGVIRCEYCEARVQAKWTSRGNRRLYYVCQGELELQACGRRVTMGAHETAELHDALQRSPNGELGAARDDRKEPDHGEVVEPSGRAGSGTGSGNGGRRRRFGRRA